MCERRGAMLGQDGQAALEAVMGQAFRGRRAGAWGMALLAAMLRVAHLSAAELVAHYSFNEGHGSVVRDRSGAGHSTRNLGATYVESPLGYALRFDGVDDQVIYGIAEAFDLEGSFSLALWLRTDPEQNAETTRLIFGDIANRSVARSLNLKLDKYQRIHAEWGNGQEFAFISADAALLAGGWHHLALVCDQTARQASLYVDGTPAAVKAVPFSASSPDGSRDLRSGTWWEGNAFAGEIDDIMLFKGALTAADVRIMATNQTAAQLEVDAKIHPELPPATAVAGPVSREGLVAHYTFEEGQGKRLVDHSGRGHHGQIHGADWIESPWGHALHFDGEDDWVNLGQSQDFWFTDSMTIEMWIRTEPVYPARRHPLLIGSAAADLAVERHVNVRLDHTQHFRIEWGDGERYSAVLERPWFLDGAWKHLAIVFVSGKACFLYVNGRPVLARRVSLPLTRTRGDDIHIGGWSHGYLRGDIAELRLYARALTASEIQQNGGTPADRCTPLLQTTGAYSYQQKTFLCDLFVSAEDLPGHALQARILEPDSNRVVGSAQVPLSEVLNGAGHGAARLVIPGESDAHGDLVLETALRDSAGRALFSDRTAIPYTAPPPWLTSNTGITDTILPPYTPCTVSEGDGRVVVGTWGREHRFAGDGILSQIVTQGSPLLAGPVALTGSVSGRPLNWSRPETTVVSAGPAAVQLTCRSRSGPLRLESSITLEYDGFMTVDCVLAADSEVTVENLALDIPLVPETARLLHTWPVSKDGRSGALGEGWSGPFKPVLWLGDETRGLSWVCETQQFWHPARRDRAVEVLPGAAAALLRFNLIGVDTALRPRADLRYTFGLQATPVRPMTRTYWDMRLHRQPPYAHEYDWMTKTIEGVPALEYYANHGAGGLLVWRWWDAFGYTLPLGHEKRFPDLVAACHANGLKLVPYTIGFLLSDAAPEYRVFRRDMLTAPEKSFTGVNRLPGLPSQMAYFACPNGLWTDFVTATTAECMDTYDTDGVYLDTTVRPEPCTNALHGCGWEREDGSRAPTYPVFAVRDLLKRLYAIVIQRKPHGIVEAHIYDCLNVPALAFATGYWNGEQLPHNDVVLDALPLDRFRTEFLGRNIGVPADLLFYKLRNYEAATAIALLHDVPVRSERDSNFQTIARIYRAREAFRCDEAAFHGYWEPDALIAASADGCHVSYWRHPHNGILLVVSNLNPAAQEATISIDPSRLGLHPDLAARDVIADAPLDVRNGALNLSLSPQSWKLIRLHH